MRVCAVCRVKYFKGDGTMFSIPKDEDTRRKWGEICGVTFSSYASICTKHFLPSSIVNVRGGLHLLPNAEPFVGQLPQTTQLENVDPNVGIPSFDDMQDLHSFGTVKHDTINKVASSGHQFKDQSTQTGVYVTEQETQTEYFTGKEYLEKIHALEAEIKELKNQLKDSEALADGMNKIFTQGQIRKIISPGRINWRSEDIASAICLHAAGPRAYNHLYEKGFPLPHKKTLQRWCKNVTVKEGLLSASIEVMRQKKDVLTVDEKICVLAFDEMKVAEMYFYDQFSDIVEKPKKYVQVVIYHSH